jgi:signal transduction histidine kinase
MTPHDFARPAQDEPAPQGAIAQSSARREPPRRFAPHPDARFGLAATVAAWAAGIALTALVLDFPQTLLTVRSPQVRLAVATASCCVAILAAYLIHQRYRREARHQDLLVAQGLLLLAVAGPSLAALTPSPTEPSDGWYTVWLPETLRALGALLVLAGALVPGRRVERFASRWRTLLVPAALALLATAVLAALRPESPDVVRRVLRSSVVAAPTASGSAGLLVLEGIAAAALLAASARFGLQSRERRTPIFLWLGPAFALLGFARVTYLLIPTHYTDWIYSGDLLRALSYGILTFAAFRELHGYWLAQARVAVLDDRRRLARDLHDGVVQELAYIRSEAHSLTDGSTVRARILQAADRGLDETRTAIRLLARVPEESLHETLRIAAREVAMRYEIDLRTDLDETVEADPDQKQALMRIVREAVSNAARHGDAKQVFVRLDRGESGFVLRIEDDGRGFDVGSTRGQATGYGLVSMTERAALLPGRLGIASAPSTGTVVTVQW